MTQMKDQNKPPGKGLSETEIANLSDAKFKTLVIRILSDITEYDKNVREEMKAILKEIKKYFQETNSEGKEARL